MAVSIIAITAGLWCPRRVANRVAGHGGLVGLGALAAAVIALVSTALLCVVPRAAAVGHRNGDEQPGRRSRRETGARPRQGRLTFCNGGDRRKDDDRGEHRKQ